MAKIEMDVMSLPPEQREHLALSAWESLGDGSNAEIVSSLDPEGVEIAKERERELSSGIVSSITRSEFLERIDDEQ